MDLNNNEYLQLKKKEDMNKIKDLESIVVYTKCRSLGHIRTNRC